MRLETAAPHGLRGLHDPRRVEHAPVIQAHQRQRRLARGLHGRVGACAVGGGVAHRVHRRLAAGRHHPRWALGWATRAAVARVEAEESAVDAE